MAVKKSVYRVRITETVYLAKDVYIAAWSEDEAHECVDALLDEGELYPSVVTDIADSEGTDVEFWGVVNDIDDPDYDAAEVLGDN